MKGYISRMNSLPRQVSHSTALPKTALSSVGTRSWVAGVFALGFLAFGPFAMGQTERFWTSEQGGEWFDSGNWADDEVPTAGERAIFDLEQPTAYEVELDDPVNTGGLQVRNDVVTLDLSGENLTLTEAPTGSYSNNDNLDLQAALMIGRGVSGDHYDGSLVIEGGGVVTTTSLMIGGTSSSSGVLTLQGSGTQLVVQNSEIDNAIVGVRGYGEFNVLSGATATFEGGMVGGRAATGTFRMTVDGTGSAVYSDANLFLGRFSRDSEIMVQNGGHIEAASTLQMGRDSTLTFDNATGTFGALNMGISDGTLTMIIRNGSEVAFSGSIQITQGSASDIESYVEVTGSNSLLTVGSSMFVGGTTATDREEIGVVTVSDGGTVEVDGRLRLWSEGTLALDAGTVQASELDARAGSVFALTLHTERFDPDLRLVEAGGFDGDVFLNFVNGDGVTLDLDLATGFSANIDDVFTVLSYEGILTGTFQGLDQGDTFMVGGYEFQIDYGFTFDDAITLTVIPEPGVAGLLLAPLLAWAMRRRRK